MNVWIVTAQDDFDMLKTEHVVCVKSSEDAALEAVKERIPTDPELASNVKKIVETKGVEHVWELAVVHPFPHRRLNVKKYEVT